MKYIILLLACSAIFTSCFDFGWRNVSPPEYTKVWGYKPVYTADTSYRVVEYIPYAQTVENAGKIYVKGNLIYQCETGKGIHIIDNTIPSGAKRIAFLAVKGCEEIAIKGNFLYTNNYYDLVTINISVPQNAQVVARTKDAFYASSSVLHTWETPPQPGYFQCPQFYRDSVISGWVQDSIFASCHQ